VCNAVLHRDETLLATAYSSLDERGEPRAMPEKRRKERERKREKEKARTGGGEGYLHRNASPGSPRYARERARGSVQARTHVLCVRHVSTRETPKERSRGFPLMPEAPSA